MSFLFSCSLSTTRQCKIKNPQHCSSSEHVIGTLEKSLVIIIRPVNNTIKSSISFHVLKPLHRDILAISDLPERATL